MAKFQNQTLHRVARAVAKPALEDGQEDVGLGDVFHGVTRRIGIKHCAKCKKRKQKANAKVVFGRPR
jgi:hypothetical protein